MTRSGLTFLPLAVAASVSLLFFSGLGGRARGEDWPSFRNGAARHGSISAKVDGPLQSAWTYQAAAPPRMAWASAEGRVMEQKLIGHRSKYDDAIHPVIVGDRVYFGSSVDHHLHCLDLASGASLWNFATGGPIRLAPTVDGGRVYFGCDDGHAYCLSADSGALIWRRQAGPSDEWLLARGEMISRWPVRTGVLVDDGVAFFGAGIFPHEDVYIYAVNAADGSVIWQQDNLSVQDAGRNDLSPQGYLLADDKHLYVPSGRSLPAALDRKTGEFLYKRTFSWRTTAGGVIGGIQALVSDGQLYASGPHHWLALDEQNGDVGFGWFAGRQLIVHGDAAYAATGAHLARLDRVDYAVNSRERHRLEMVIHELNGKTGKTAEEQAAIAARIAAAQKEIEAIAMVGIRWQQPSEDDAALLATDNLVFLGGENRVTAFSVEDGQEVWKAPVDGQARGLVFARGHLLVSTTSGRIECFSASEIDPATRQSQLAGVRTGEEQPFPQDERSKLYADAAEQILEESGVRRGFCLVVGNEQGRLAWELARRSELQVYAIESDAAKVDAARQRLLASGLYGHRIVVHQAEPGQTPYSNYFANLIVSDTLLSTGKLPAGSGQVARHLKPEGGVMLLGAPASAPPAVAEAVSRSETTALWLRDSEIEDQTTKTTTPHWTRLTRGGLPGAGDWTHQYGNPANTAVSTDTRIQGGLGVLWYGDPGPNEMVNRHEGAVGPLCVKGRLIVQGEWSIMAYDAYNGLFLWKHENPEAIRTGVFQNQNPANVAANDDSVFHFIRDQCLQLDAATGETHAIHRLPAQLDDGRYQWGYMAIQDGILIGAATVRTELEARLRRRGRQTEDSTDYLFAIDLETGKHLWLYEGQHVSHHTIALGPGEVFFVDSSISSERREELLRADKTGFANLTGKERELAEARAKDADIRQTIALDARSGEKRWAVAVDVTDCSDIGIGGGKLTLMYQDGVLLLGGANANGHFWKQFIEGEFSRRRLVALQAEDGYKLWSRDANYKGRPIVLGNKVLAEPWIYDLHSGSQQTQIHPVTQEEVPWSLMRTGHHCGIFTGCDSGMLLFRSGDTAFYDMESESGTRHFAGHRLGCWINAIPAGGLVMIPEASAGCVCLYSIASTIVMEPRAPRRQWAIHSAVGSLLPVRQLLVNFGAPGDRKDAAGNLWLAYPRPKPYKETSLDIDLQLRPEFEKAARYWSVKETAAADANSPTLWLYDSGAERLQRLTVPLRGPDDGPATYAVKLHFAMPADQASVAAPNVKFQGKVLAQGTETSPAAGDASAASVLILTATVLVEGELQIEIPLSEQSPRLCGMEVRQSE